MLSDVFYIFIIIEIVLSQNVEKPIETCTSSQYFSVMDLTCKSCDPTTEQSFDGYSCKCKAKHRLILNKGGDQVQCQACFGTQVVSDDGWECLDCINCDNSCPTVTLKRGLLGNPSNAICSNCTGIYKFDNSSSSCQLCSSQLLAGSINCTCPPDTSYQNSKYCSSTIISIETLLPYVDAATSVKSAYLTENLAIAISLCKKSVTQACESVANMCVIQHYNRAINNNACDHILKSFQITMTIYGWPTNFPWLYFSQPLTLTALRVLKQYSRNETLSIILGTYNVTGHFLGYRNASNGLGLLQLCTSSPSRMAQAFIFGTLFKESCTITNGNFFDRQLYPVLFYEPFLSYKKADGKSYYYPLPIKISQLKISGGSEPNKDTNSDSFIFTRRLLMVDNIGAITETFLPNRTAEFVTVAKNIRIVIIRDTSTPFDITTDGRIYAPYIEVNLTSISKTKSSEITEITFEVVYRNADQVTEQIHYSLSVAMGVLCALAGLYAILRTYFWVRRSGCDRFEWIALVKCLAYACSSISNTFFLVMFGFCLYYLLLYKNQQLFAVIPPENDNFFVAYLIAAFILKLFEVIHLFVVQCSVDIFFIDWERPKHAHAPKTVIEKSKFDQTGDRGDFGKTGTNLVTDTPPTTQDKIDNHVSIWRTYFVANEWNEIQIFRKTSLMFNLMIVILFMDVIGFKNVTVMDPFSELNPGSDYYKAPYSRLFRFALIVLIFGITGFIQWLYTILFYERLVDDKLRSYVDLCSVANVSILILEHRQFGYYIHGRSVHGSADVSLIKMYEALRKENEGTCAKRGLETDSDQQTYIVSLPDDFRRAFDPIYDPTIIMTSGDSNKSTDEKRTLQYLQVNKFLDRFINRTNNPRIDFVFQDRKFFEDLFDGEFENNSLQGRFYRDNGTSFGNVLFYGNELALITFDMLLFNVLDLILQNTVFDAVLTWAIVIIFQKIRHGCGSYNLAKKTMVDRRFLI